MSNYLHKDKKLLAKFTQEEVAKIANEMYENSCVCNEKLGDGLQLIWINAGGTCYFVFVDSKFDLLYPDVCFDDVFRVIEDEFNAADESYLNEDEFYEAKANIPDGDEDDCDYDHLHFDTFEEYKEAFEFALELGNGYSWGLECNFKTGAMDSDLHTKLREILKTK